jgi:hypothetical protein
MQDEACSLAQTVRPSQGRAVVARLPQMQGSVAHTDGSAGRQRGPLSWDLFESAGAAEPSSTRSPLQPLTNVAQEQLPGSPGAAARISSPSKSGPAEGDSPILLSESPSRWRSKAHASSPPPLRAAGAGGRPQLPQQAPDVSASMSSLGTSIPGSAAAGAAAAAEAPPGQAETVMVCNPLFTNPSTSAAVEAGEVRTSANAPQRAAWPAHPDGSAPGEPVSAGLLGSAAQAVGCSERGAPAAQTAQGSWGGTSKASAAAPVSLVSSPQVSTAHVPAPASACSVPGAASASPLPQQRVDGSSAAPGSPVPAPSAAPDLESVNMPRRSPHVAADRPLQLPSSCASKQPFFPPASHYAPAPAAVLARARGPEAASGPPAHGFPAARAAQAPEAGTDLQEQQARLAAAEESAATRALTTIEVPGAAPVSSAARMAWQQRQPVSMADSPTHAPVHPTALLRPRPGPLAASSPAVLRTSLHAPAPQAAAEPAAAPPLPEVPLTSRSEPAPGQQQHRREPSTLEFLRRSGILPAQGPLGASGGALLGSSPAEASPASRPRLRPPPQHLRTPTLMLRAGAHSACCGVNSCQ